MQSTLQGRFWISKSEHNFLGEGRIRLLINIGKSGSITKAAKAMKMSYKAAWDAVDAMNNLSEHPLVQSSKGGKGGGGTHLTEYAKELINTYEILQEEHQQFLDNLSKRISEKNGHVNLLKSMDIRISARNQLKAEVVKIEKGAVESKIFLKLHGEDTIMAIITNDSIDTLALTVDTDTTLNKSDLNRFIGKIIRINTDSFNAEVIIELNGGNTICSTMSTEKLDEQKLEIGMEVVAFCKPNTIILGIW